MKWLHLRPQRADIKAHFALIRAAFDGVSDAKNEYEYCCDSVRDSSAAMYLLTGDGIKLRFVGEVREPMGDYFILAMTGCGMSKAAPHIIKQARHMGYTSISYQTRRKGMRTILTAFGFEQVAVNAHGETTHRLLL